MYQELIDRKIKLPVYEQVYQAMKKLIDNEEIVSFGRIPSEHQLCKDFGVSRVTIRAALDRLEESGYIQKSQGKESRVINRSDSQVWTDLTDLSNDLVASLGDLRSEIIFSGMTYAPEKAVRSLGISAKDKVYSLKRVRTLNGVKVVYSESYLLASLPIDYDNIELSPSISLKKIFKDNGIKMTYCDESLEVMIPTDELSDLLDLDGDTALFFRERVTYDELVNPFEYVVNYYHGKHFKYFIRKGRA